MGEVPVPDLLGQEEGVIADLSLEWVGWNTEEGISIGEVVMPSGVLMLQTPPRRVIKVREHRVVHVSIGTVETFNSSIVLL
jgi:hypothetical protein